jgi:hypothetical protein
MMVPQLTATPAEADALAAWLAPVPQERHAAIAAMMFAEVSECPKCADAVRRCGPRILRADGRLWHLDCPPEWCRCPGRKRRDADGRCFACGRMVRP